MQKDRIKIARKKVWEKILPFSQMVFHHPQNGWVKTIREILGMTSAQLGKRIDIAQSSLLKLEQREKTKSITLKSLEKAARSLNCRVEYVLIPNEPFETMIKNKAEQLAKKRLKETSVSMGLENQGIKSDDMKEHLKLMTEQLIQNADSEIWED